MRKQRFRQFTTVLGYEFTNFLHSKSYIATMVIVSALLVIALSFPAISQAVRSVNPDDPSTTKADPKATVHVIDRTGVAPSLDAIQKVLPDLRLATAPASQLDALREQVRNGDARAVFLIESTTRFTLVIRRSGIGDASFQKLYSMLDAWFRTRRLNDLGLDPQAVESVLTPATLEQVETASETGKTMQQAYVSTYFLLMLLYMTVMIYGQTVATSVAAEKSNRAMEMLITSADPMSLMFGKVIGAGLAGLAQVGVFIAVAFGAYSVNASHYASVPMIRSAFAMPLKTLLMTVLFYLLGYFMYAFLYGALGSLASRTEDINNSIMPIVLLFVTAMMLSFVGMVNPESTLTTVVSFIPLFAPMTMFVRMNMTDVPLFQLLLSIALMLLTTFGLGWLSARIYRIGVLMYGKPPKVRELVGILRSEAATR